MSVSDIESRVHQFAAGFYNCATSGAYVNVIVGTSTSSSPSGSPTYAHGAAWAQMVNSAENWITSPPSYAAHVEAQGGSDIEIHFNCLHHGFELSAGLRQREQFEHVHFGDARAAT